MKKISVIIACASALAAILACAAACDSTLPQQPCREIPDGGCPAYDNACDDPTCFKLYDCEPDDTWKLDTVCPAKVPIDAAGIPIDTDSGDAASNVDASAYINVPGALGGPGCDDLQTPDCSLGTAAACTGNCCDCEDLYVCANGGWNLWGECANGQITQNPGDGN